MSSYEFRRVRAKVNGDQELVELVKQFIEALLDDGNEDMSLVVDEVEISAEDLSETSTFDTIEFTFEYYDHETFELYEHLIECCTNRGEGFGVLEDYGCDDYVALTAYGDSRRTILDINASEDKWGTDACPTICITLPIDMVCEIMDCEPIDLWDVLVDDGEPVLSELYGEDLVDELFQGETDLCEAEFGADAGKRVVDLAEDIEDPVLIKNGVDGYDVLPLKHLDRYRPFLGPDAEEPIELQDGHYYAEREISEDLASNEARLSFSPELDLFRGATIEDLTDYKDAFEAAAKIMKSCGGSIAISIGEVGDDGTNVLTAEGFKVLEFKTSPNYWGEFTAYEYELM